MDNNMNFDPMTGQPVNQQPVYQQPMGEQPVELGEWVLTLFLAAIPIVGLVMLCVWGFGSNSAESKKNWAKAALIWKVIGWVISILFYVLYFSALISALY